MLKPVSFPSESVVATDSAADGLIKQSAKFLRFPRFWVSGGLVFLGWIAWCLPGLALELRIAIQEAAHQIRVGTSNTGIIRDASGQAVGQVPGGRSLTVAAQGPQLKVNQWQGTTFWVEPGAGGFVFIGDKWYRGRVRVTANDRKVDAINYVDINHYLYSVVGGEMPASWPLEALKAQAIAARSYVLYHRQKNRNPQYDLGNTTTWQVYDGLEDEANSTRAAVDATHNQVLTYNGRIIEAVFHSSSGGHTENVEDVWSKPIPYLRGVQDFDVGAPVYQWREQLPLGDITRLMPEIGRLQQITPRRLTPQGRVQEIQLAGDLGTRIMSGNEFRRAFNLRSTLFSISVAEETLWISGRGFGHGIGMSQWGAYNLAGQGYTHQQILGHYYQGAALSQIQVP